MKLYMCFKKTGNKNEICGKAVIFDKPQTCPKCGGVNTIESAFDDDIGN